MRRFLLGILIAAMTLGLVVGSAALLAKREEAALSQDTAVQTTAAAAAESLPPETIPAETAAPEAPPPETAPSKTVQDQVPLYYQTDYPHIHFGNGTIATSGCSVTCLAMVATYLTDQEYTPVQMAYHFGSFGKNNIQRLDHGIAQMQLPYERTEDVQEVLKGLREGKVAILMMDDESVFTTEQHFIVAAGINEAGKIIVNDPLETNYLNGQLHVKDGYENGFEDHYLMQGFSGGWLFHKADMPEDPFLFDASMPEQKENRYEGYTLTEEDIYTLACFVYVEAGDQEPQVRQAVAEVVLNRIISPDYPNTVTDILKKTEFYRALDAMAYVDEPGLDAYIAVDMAMYGPYVLPKEVVFYSQWEKNGELWGQLGDYTFAYTRG